MSETNEPTKNMLDFIRVLLSRSMGDECANSLPDNEIAWIAPLVTHEIFKLKTIDMDVVILHYGLYEHKPLNLSQIGVTVKEGSPLSREQVSQIIEHTTNALSRAIRIMNCDEYNLYKLLAGKRGATPVLNANKAAAVYDIAIAIDCLKRIQIKNNINNLIEKFKESLGKETPE